MWEKITVEHTVIFDQSQAIFNFTAKGTGKMAYFSV